MRDVKIYVSFILVFAILIAGFLVTADLPMVTKGMDGEIYRCQIDGVYYPKNTEQCKEALSGRYFVEIIREDQTERTGY